MFKYKKEPVKVKLDNSCNYHKALVSATNFNPYAAGC